MLKIKIRFTNLFILLSLIGIYFLFPPNSFAQTTCSGVCFDPAIQTCPGVTTDTTDCSSSGLLCCNKDPLLNCNGTCRSGCLSGEKVNTNPNSCNSLPSTPICCEQIPQDCPAPGNPEPRSCQTEDFAIANCSAYSDSSQQCNSLDQPGQNYVCCQAVLRLCVAANAAGDCPPNRSFKCAAYTSTPCCVNESACHAIPVFCDEFGNQTSNPPYPPRFFTAIGCIDTTNPQTFTGEILRAGIGVGGAIALALIAVAAFLIISSGGNPQRLQAGKELLNASLAGLFLLVLGAFVLQLIGVQILNIPGFGP